MLEFKEQTKDRIAAELGPGHAAGEWRRAVQESSDPYFLKAIRTMLRRDDIPAGATYAGVREVLPFLGARRVKKHLQALGKLADLLNRPADRFRRPVQVQDQAIPQALGGLQAVFAW